MENEQTTTAVTAVTPTPTQIKIPCLIVAKIMLSVDETTDKDNFIVDFDLSEIADGRKLYLSQHQNKQSVLHILSDVESLGSVIK